MMLPGSYCLTSIGRWTTTRENILSGYQPYNNDTGSFSRRHLNIRVGWRTTQPALINPPHPGNMAGVGSQHRGHK